MYIYELTELMFLEDIGWGYTCLELMHLVHSRCSQTQKHCQKSKTSYSEAETLQQTPPHTHISTHFLRIDYSTRERMCKVSAFLHLFTSNIAHNSHSQSEENGGGPKAERSINM